METIDWVGRWEEVPLASRWHRDWAWKKPFHWWCFVDAANKLDFEGLIKSTCMVGVTFMEELEMFMEACEPSIFADTWWTIWDCFCLGKSCKWVGSTLLGELPTDATEEIPESESSWWTVETILGLLYVEVRREMSYFQEKLEYGGQDRHSSCDQ